MELDEVKRGGDQRFLDIFGWVPNRPFSDGFIIAPMGITDPTREWRAHSMSSLIEELPCLDLASKQLQQEC